MSYYQLGLVPKAKPIRKGPPVIIGVLLAVGFGLVVVGGLSKILPDMRRYK